MAHIKRIDEFNSTMQEYAAKLEKALMTYCSYNGITRDKDTGREYPNHMGELLDEYGFECDWSIRPKEFRVDVKGYPEEYLEVTWVTQDTIDDETSVNCLKDMFAALIEKANRLFHIGAGNMEDGYDIVFKCGCRDYFKKDNPQYVWKLAVGNNGSYELVDM